MELGKKYHMDQRTAKRYAESPEKPKYTLTGPKPSKLDGYKQQIDQWLEEVSAPVIKCKKTPRKKCSLVAERREKR